MRLSNPPRRRPQRHHSLQRTRRPVHRRRLRDRRIRHPRQRATSGRNPGRRRSRLHVFNPDLRHPNRLVRTCLHTGGRFALRQSSVAKVTLPHDPALRRILRHVVRTLQDAVAAPDALVVQMPYDPGQRVLVVRQHRTALETPGLRAMMTRARHRKGHRLRRAMRQTRRIKLLSQQQRHLAPRLVIVEPVHRVARRNTRLARGTAVEVHLEGVLLSRERCRQRHQLPVMRFKQRRRRIRMALRELLHRRQLALLRQKDVHQRLDAFGNLVRGADAHRNGIWGYAENSSCRRPTSWRAVNCWKVSPAVRRRW